MNRISKICITICIFLSITFNVYAQLLGATLATVRLTETEVVSKKDMEEQFTLLERQIGSELSAPQKEEVFQSRLNSILINQAARRAKLQPTETEIKNAIDAQKATLGAAISDIEYQRLIIEQTGLSWESYRRQIEERLLQEKYISYARPDILQNVSQPTEQEIKTIYEQNAQSFVSPALSGFSHIFIDLRGQSDSERNEARIKMNGYNSRIRNGGRAEFDKIVRETLDDASVTGGDFGYVLSGDPNAVEILGNTFVTNILAMAEGDISGIMESNIGFHIVRISDRRSPRLLDLDDPLLPGQNFTVRQNIVQFIVNQKQQEALIQALGEITTELRGEANIRIFEDSIPW